MTDENFQMALWAFSHVRPFRPFLIELHSGAQIRVRHPEAVRFCETLAVHRSPDGTYTLFDHESVSRVFPEPGPTAPPAAPPSPSGAG